MLAITLQEKYGPFHSEKTQGVIEFDKLYDVNKRKSIEISTDNDGTISFYLQKKKKKKVGCKGN
jgi:hypothetical protein